MKKSTLFLLDILNFSLCFFVASWFFVNFLFTYSIEIFQIPKGHALEILVTLVLILVMSIFGFVCLRLLYWRRLNRKHLTGLYLVYFSLLFYVLFLKNIGLKGYELNPLTYFDGLLYGFWFEPVMNLLMFIPLSLLFKMTWRRALLSLSCLLLVEVLQYLLHLGVFDIGDLLANFASLCLGQVLRMGLLRLGLRSWLDRPRETSP